MFEIIDYTNLMQPYTMDIQKKLKVLVRYVGGHSAPPDRIDADAFLRYREGHNRLWVTTSPLYHNDGPVWGFTEGQRAIVSTYGLSLGDASVVVMHELGHMLGLGHCHRICLMASAHPAEVVPYLCSHCAAFVSNQVKG